MEENQDTTTPQVENNSTTPNQVESNASQSTQNDSSQSGGQPAGGGTSDDTRTIVTVLLLIFFYPVGLVLMWVWTTWKGWVKWLITVLGCLPVILVFMGLFSVGFLAAINPEGAMKMAECANQCESYVGEERDMCVKSCAGDDYLEYLDENMEELEENLEEAPME